MKASINLNEITKLSGGTEVAQLSLTLKSESLVNFGFNGKATFGLSSTGMSLRVTSEHSVFELKCLCDWLSKESLNKSNLRDNESEVVIFAKDMIKANRQLGEIRTF